MLRYCETALSVTGAVGAVGGYVFSANGCFDPNITGTGHQPMGFDQMMLMYEQATVVKSRVSFSVNNASAANIAAGVGVYLSPDTTVLTSMSRSLEAGLINYRMLSPINVFGAFVNDLALSCDIRKYFGRSRPSRDILNDTELATTAASNPIEQVYYILVVTDLLTGANTTVLDFVVNIEYDIIFWEPRKLIQS